MFRLGEIARDNKGVVFNLVLSLGVLLLGPWYITQVKYVRDYAQHNTAIALILACVLLAEPFAFYFKVNSVYANDHVARSFTGRYVFLWVAHIVVTVLTLLVATMAMPPGLHWLDKPLLWTIGVKEFLLVFFLIARQAGDEPYKGNPPTPPKKVSDRKVFFSDVILSVYAFLVFGIAWQSVGASGFLSGMRDDIADSIAFRLCMYAVMFIIIYYPIRLAHFIEEWLNNRTKEQKRNYRISFIITMISCIGPLFVGGRVPDANEINFRDPAGKTVLINAIEYEPLPYITRLIDAGATVDAQDTSGYTALHYAAKGGRYEAVKLLLQKGANPNMRMKDGGTAVALAAGFQHADVVELLLQHGADPNLAFSDGATPLMVAAEQGFEPRTIEVLLKYKANANAQDSTGYNALMRWEHYHNLAKDYDQTIFELLVKATDLQRRDKAGHTIVWHATRYNSWPYTDVAGALLGAGAAIDSSDIINKDGYNIVY